MPGETSTDQTQDVIIYHICANVITAFLEEFVFNLPRGKQTLRLVRSVLVLCYTSQILSDAKSWPGQAVLATGQS